ncbi:MAG TPA: hypothetical protein VNZ53_56695 [Steroidobacteraceae bacterium]|nr:hypothetical protein [Steroidobacteraceae bacterium]
MSFTAQKLPITVVVVLHAQDRSYSIENATAYKGRGVFRVCEWPSQAAKIVVVSIHDA